jgi:hypothetical protein
VAKSKYGWIGWLIRFRPLVPLAFWGLVGTRAFLYANSTKCWSSLPPALQEWAQDIYGNRLPPLINALEGNLIPYYIKLTDQR